MISERGFDRLITVVVVIFLILTLLFGVSFMSRFVAMNQIQENVELMQQTTSELQETVNELSAIIDNPALEEIHDALDEMSHQLEVIEETIHDTSLITDPVEITADPVQNTALLMTIARFTGIMSVVVAVLFGIFTVMRRKSVKRLRLDDRNR
jgi:ABC-type dipeptide/oligopeptide/nickel transport system permease component